jgi:hypothetical protein
MSQTTTLIILPQTSYNANNTLIFSDKIAAAGYYQNFLNQQTFTWNITSFIGSIIFQGSIVTDPTSNSDWFQLLPTMTFPAPGQTQASFTTLQANLVWVRARVNWSQGVIQNIKVSY